MKTVIGEEEREVGGRNYSTISSVFFPSIVSVFIARENFWDFWVFCCLGRLFLHHIRSHVHTNSIKKAYLAPRTMIWERGRRRGRQWNWENFHYALFSIMILMLSSLSHSLTSCYLFFAHRPLLPLNLRRWWESPQCFYFILWFHLRVNETTLP